MAPRKYAESKLEVVRTVAAICAACGTLFLIGAKMGWW